MFRLAQRVNTRPSSGWWVVLAAVLASVTLSMALALVSTSFQGIQGWVSFLALILLVSGIAWGGVWALRGEAPPRWLGSLLLGAALLRLAVGAVWFVALPIAGHGSPEEKAGYVMADARERDETAWKLGHSDKPLWEAFFRFRKADQYGGLLFLSAIVYRLLGGAYHKPLLMVGITAAFSSLAILFTWAFSRRAWGDDVAKVAAWCLALYPEAVLLGSSQMREAFTMTFAAASFYGLVRYSRDRSWVAVGWMLGPLLLNLPLSPPLTALLMGMLALTALAMRKDLFQENLLHDRRLWLVLVGLVVLVVLGLWLSWRQFSPASGFNLLELAGWWIRKSAEWQAYLSRHASGWIQKIFRSTPEALHLPLLLAYGIVQPFLPGALVATSEAPIWRWVIQPWRSIGWSLLLPFLAYGAIRALFRVKSGGFARGLSLTVWLGILAASYRGGADGWDNPRYRVAFAALQVALAAWAFVEQRRAADPWLRRILVGIGLILGWFIPWYLNRYFNLLWPVSDVFKTLGLGFASAILYAIWDWARKEKT